MSERIRTLFSSSQHSYRPVLIAYLCVGDPSLEASLTLARCLLDAGVDVLELGIPYSDPTADGPVIARASMRAIQQGGSLRAAINLASQLRLMSEVPLILFGYVNPFLMMGERDSVRAAANAGIDGLLIVDLPPEEGSELRSEAKKCNIDMIPLVAPTTSETRMQKIKNIGSGFVYSISVAGVTGTHIGDEPLLAAAKKAAYVREQMDLPVVVGFGIDTAQKAKQVCRYDANKRGADGVVVGSAIVQAIENAHEDVHAACEQVTLLVRSIRNELDQLIIN